MGRYPGFHTADNLTTTYAYAQMKTVPRHVDPHQTIDDYPVIVALDMQGLTPLSDYDAEVFFRDTLQSLAKDVVKEANKQEKSPHDELSLWVDMGDYTPHPVPQNIVAYLHAAAIDNESSMLLYAAEQTNDPDEFIRRTAEKKITEQELAWMIGQFRYDENISSKRITKVFYLRPWFPEIFDYEIASDEEKRLVEDLEEEGWSIADISDMDVNAQSTVIYEKPEPPNARVEYHGTSYRNLLLATPELDLPTPPPPYSAS